MLKARKQPPVPMDLPDLPEYLQAKTGVAALMRDFTDNKIHFVGIDGHAIVMAEYQSISRFTKSGEDPARFMQGEVRVFKTGYNKKTNTFTENRLFVPKFQYYDPSAVAAAAAATASVSMLSIADTSSIASSDVVSVGAEA